jgi:hypothetical protein
LKSRQIQLRPFHIRDAFIPLVASLAGAGVGFGLDEVALAATNTIPTRAGMLSGKTAMQQVLHHPGEALQGVGQGLCEQMHEMASAAYDVHSGVIPGSGPCGQILQAHTAWVPSSSARGHAGFYEDLVLAKSAEHATMSLAATQGTWSAMEACAGHAERVKPGSHRR